ncbi:MAG: hypothetical protein KDJ50_11130 [Alphaproteobacteria bacterium]|nr:hypothetical protein [Alphaproteobacteria bacterium]
MVQFAKASRHAELGLRGALKALNASNSTIVPAFNEHIPVAPMPEFNPRAPKIK